MTEFRFTGDFRAGAVNLEVSLVDSAGRLSAGIGGLRMRRSSPRRLRAADVPHLFSVSLLLSGGNPSTTCTIAIVLKSDGVELGRRSVSVHADSKGAATTLLSIRLRERNSPKTKGVKSIRERAGVRENQGEIIEKGAHQSGRQSGKDAHAEYQVWYGTNRQPIDPTNAASGFSSRRDVTLHHGRCRVYVPRTHKIGSTGSPWWKRLFIGDDRLKLLSTEAMEAAAFWRNVREALSEVAQENDRCAVVFIHGYNVTFEQAAIRAAQIGIDLSIKGAMAFFSWPSCGATELYTFDEAVIDASEMDIQQFLVDFVDRSGATAVHVIAHSMGNRGFLKAVERIATSASRRTKIPFAQLILAAPDVDTGVFRNLCANYPAIAQQTTLYVSTKDLAVEASGWLHGFPRVGLMPPVFTAPGIDTVNVTNADLTLLGHGYVATARSVLADMHSLITRAVPPKMRFGLLSRMGPQGEYWEIGR